MILSMTGFAALTHEADYGAINLELRAVNHRYLEIQFRVQDEFRVLESALRELVAGRISRGKIDCRIGFSPVPGARRGVPLDREFVTELLRHAGEVRELAPDAAPLRCADILRWPGAFGQDSVPAERLAHDALALAARALDELGASRRREGEKLRALLLERVAAMEEIATAIRPQIPQLVAAFRDKLAARLADASHGTEDDRVRQEIVMFASRIDVDEELSRLGAHLVEVRRVLDQKGPAGKRLDFLMQELNREANTLGSKSVATTLSQAAIELKILIEQMREQIQNIE